MQHFNFIITYFLQQGVSMALLNFRY